MYMILLLMLLLTLTSATADIGVERLVGVTVVIGVELQIVEGVDDAALNLAEGEGH